MAYTTKESVAGEFKSVAFSATSTPTSTQVDEFISQEEAVINAWVSKRYTTPVAAAESLKVLKRLATQMVAHRVREIIQVKGTGSSADQSGSAKKTPYEMALAQLKSISTGEMPLSDATLATSHGGVESFNVDEEIEYKFKRGEKQW